MESINESQNPDKSNKKSSSKKLHKSTSLILSNDFVRQKRRDVRRLNNLLKKYNRHMYEHNRSILNSSTNKASNSGPNPVNLSTGLNNSEKDSRDQNKYKGSREAHHRGNSYDFRHYLGSAFKNSLGHVNDHIIATLPTEMSLYYQKLQDTLMLDMNENSNQRLSPRESASTTSNQQQMNEMHEFISSSTEQFETGESNNSLSEQEQTSTSNKYDGFYNPYAPPLQKPTILPIRDFLQDPLNASLNTLNRVTNFVRLPSTQLYNHGYNIWNTLNPIPTPSETTKRPPGMAERVILDECNTVPLPPPVLPLIECTLQQIRLNPLSLEEFEESQSWTIETLRQRVFKGGISEELRLNLWPFILGLCDDDDDDDNIDIRRKQLDWSSKEKLFQHYRSQWKSILPEQEKRFMLFRERKSLIERDVIRCDRTHPFYLGDKNENLNKLKELLLTYMMYDFDTGYVQGMSDLASPLLYVAKGDTCKAFWFFVKIMEFTNNNFEMSQMTIKYQLEMLWKLIELTDPVFAQYLANNESVNCYFAFRWIVCQFKREFMKTNSDDYQEVLLLWESIWTCSSIKKYLLKLKQQKQNDQPDLLNERKMTESTVNVKVTNSSKTDVDSNDGDENITTDCEVEALTLAHNLNDHCKIYDSAESPNPLSSTETSEGLPISPFTLEDCNNRSNIYSGRRLSDTELYVLCICLSIIRRERDLIMAKRFDATEILKHFNTLYLTTNLKNILIHAANIWSWLIFDENDKLLYCGEEQPTIGNHNSKHMKNNNDLHHNQSIDTEDYDLLQDLNLPLDRQMSLAEDYCKFSNI